MLPTPICLRRAQIGVSTRLQALNRGGLLGEPRRRRSPGIEPMMEAANILLPKKILLVLHYCDAIFAATDMLTKHMVEKSIFRNGYHALYDITSFY